jgi:glycosyltransferase involved in cell wall biosynthesis
LKIAVNTRLLLNDRLEGIGWFSYETLKRITQQHPEHEFLFLFDRPYDKSFIFSDNIKPIVLFPQARHPILFYIYFEFSIPRILKKEKVDLFLSPDGFLSLKTAVPQLAVMHDLNFEHYPEALPSFITKYYRKFFPRFAKKAKRIATVSEYSKKDIENTYGIDPSKIDVVYNGVNGEFNVVSAIEQEKTRQKLTNGKPYFVFVGSLHPRKNIIRLLKAYESFREKSDMDISMIIVGEAMWGNKDVEAQISSMSFKEDVITTGRLKPIELARTIGSALAMTFVPLFEGFGIPALEAMKCGVPVIASNRTSLPEVVGKAAVLVNPESVEEITGAMLSVAQIEEVRSKMIILGLEQAKEYSWDRSAELLWESIEKVMS